MKCARGSGVDGEGRVMNSTVRCLGVAAMVAIATGVCSGTTYAAAGLTADPTAVTFSSMDAEAGIRLFLDGKAVGKSQVESIFIGVEKKSYARMFIVRFSDSDAGLLLLKPNPSQAEVGSYDLRIRAAGQDVTVTVFMPLDQLPDMLENEAARRGISVEALREAYSLTTRTGRERIEVKLPERMTEGTILEIPVGGDPEHVFSWTVNGKRVLEGKGKSTLRFPLNEVGEYTVAVEERKGDAVVASWSGPTSVVPREPIEWTISAAGRL